VRPLILNFNEPLMELYPLKFAPILKERIWGGEHLEMLLGKELTDANASASADVNENPGN